MLGVAHDPQESARRAARAELCRERLRTHAQRLEHTADERARLLELDEQQKRAQSERDHPGRGRELE